MALLYKYLRGYMPIVLLALGLAAVNQVFSLLDPLIFRHVIDDYATKYDHYTHRQFFIGVTLLLSATVGVALVSRIAKNFQDYFVNVVTQRLGAQLYSDGIRHSLCPSRCSRISAAARHSASCRRSGTTRRSSSRPS